MNDENIFEQKFTVFSYLTDRKSQLSPKDLLILMQEVAWAHVDSHDIGWSYLKQRGQFWALIRLYIKIDRFPKWNEQITIRTWGKPSDMLMHYRDHEILDEEGNVIIRSTSAWVILDFATAKPQKVDALPTHLYINTIKNAIKELPPKIQKVTFPEERAYKPVAYSDIDVNQHVNNSKYLQFAIDELDIEYVTGHDLKEIKINYIHQAKAGDYYAVQHVEVEPGNFITGIFSKEDARELCRLQTAWERKQEV